MKHPEINAHRPTVCCEFLISISQFKKMVTIKSGAISQEKIKQTTTVRFKTPVNMDDFGGWLTGALGEVEQAPVKWAFSRRASGSESVK